MKSSTVITLTLIAAAVAGAVLLRRKLKPEQEQARLIQVSAPTATVTASFAAPKIVNPIKAKTGAQSAPVIALKPKHPAKLIQEANWSSQLGSVGIEAIA